MCDVFSRLSGEDGRHFFPLIVKHFSRLGKVFQVRTCYKISLHRFVCFIMFGSVLNVALLNVLILKREESIFILNMMCLS